MLIKTVPLKNTIYLITQIITYCKYYLKMDALYLTSNSEDEDKKWVLRKKHELLKAKYKYLKRIFQLHDTNITKIDSTNQHLAERTYNTKTDAQVGTDDLIDEHVNSSKSKINKHPIRINNYKNKIDAKIGTDVNSVDEGKISIYKKKRSKTTTIYQSVENNGGSKNNCNGKDLKGTDEYGKPNKNHKLQTVDRKNNENLVDEDANSIDIERKSIIKDPNNKSKDSVEESDTLTRVLSLSHKRTPSKLQLFIKRIFRMRTDENCHECKKFRRRYLTLKRRKVRRVQSEGILNKKPHNLIRYVQSVQKYCLRDTTARQCPITDCRMIFYGIINYNDHLNLCHFAEKKFRCHYCHEGFESVISKVEHENEHLGINKVELIDNCKNNDVNDTTKLNRLLVLFDKIIDSGDYKNDNSVKINKENKKRKHKKTSRDINFVNKNGELKIRSKEDSINFDSASNATRETRNFKNNKQTYKWIPGTKIIHV